MSRRVKRSPLAKERRASTRQSFTAVIEKCAKSGLFIGHVPGFVGAHTQGATLEELRANLHAVVAMLLEDGAPRLETEFVGTLDVAVA